MIAATITFLTENDIDALYLRNRINHATWCNALRAKRGDSTSHLGCHAIRTCEQLSKADERYKLDALMLKVRDKGNKAE